jgi:hypothetical protein
MTGRVLLAAVAVLLVVFLAACGGEESQSSSPAAGAAAASSLDQKLAPALAAARNLADVSRDAATRAGNADTEVKKCTGDRVVQIPRGDRCYDAALALARAARDSLSAADVATDAGVVIATASCAAAAVITGGQGKGAAQHICGVQGDVAGGRDRVIGIIGGEREAAWQRGFWSTAIATHVAAVADEAADEADEAIVEVAATEQEAVSLAQDSGDAGAAAAASIVDQIRAGVISAADAIRQGLISCREAKDAGVYPASAPCP